MIIKNVSVLSFKTQIVYEAVMSLYCNFIFCKVMLIYIPLFMLIYLPLFWVIYFFSIICNLLFINN